MAHKMSTRGKFKKMEQPELEMQHAEISDINNATAPEMSNATATSMFSQGQLYMAERPTPSIGQPSVTLPAQTELDTVTSLVNAIPGSTIATVMSTNTTHAAASLPAQGTPLLTCSKFGTAVTKPQTNFSVMQAVSDWETTHYPPRYETTSIEQTRLTLNGISRMQPLDRGDFIEPPVSRRGPPPVMRSHPVQAAFSTGSLYGGNYQYSIPTFNGQGRWSTFLKQFEAIAANAHWDSQEMLHYLLVSLKGDAADYAFELDRVTLQSYEALIYELDLRFRTVTTKETSQRSFYTRRKRPSENFKNFAADLKSLIVKAYPRGLTPEVREDMLMKQFFDGIADDETRYNVQYLQKPRTLDQAVELLEQYNSYWEYRRPITDRRQNRGWSPGNSSRMYQQADQKNYRGDQKHLIRCVHSNMDHDEDNSNECSPQEDSHCDPGDIFGHGQNHEQLRAVFNKRNTDTRVTSEKPQAKTNMPKSSQVSKSQSVPDMQMLYNSMTDLASAVRDLLKKHESQLKPPPTHENNSREKGQCYNCGDPTHFIKDCPLPRKRRQQSDMRSPPATANLEN